MKHVGKMIGQGNTAEIYDYGTDCVLKLYRNAMPEQVCRDEFHKTMVVCQVTAKAPWPMEIIRVDERVGAVYQKLHGKTMLDQMLLKPWKSSFYAECLADCHIGIQKPVDEEFPTVKDKLRLDIESSDALSNNEKQLIYQNLLSLPDGNTLCHFDFHPGNIMLSDKQYYILDWMTACKGDRLSDVARTGIILKFSKIPRVPFIVNMVISIFQKKLYTQYIRRYLEKTGEKIEYIEKWELVIAAARLREWIPDKEKEELLVFIRQRLKFLSLIE